MHNAHGDVRIRIVNYTGLGVSQFCHNPPVRRASAVGGAQGNRGGMATGGVEGKPRRNESTKDTADRIEKHQVYYFTGDNSE